jgi:hypothetical protein
MVAVQLRWAATAHWAVATPGVAMPCLNYFYEIFYKDKKKISAK